MVIFLYNLAEHGAESYHIRKRKLITHLWLKNHLNQKNCPENEGVSTLYIALFNSIYTHKKKICHEEFFL